MSNYYQEVYPGVELVYYGNQRQLEYDFVVAPGVDSAVIKLAFEGADRLDLNAQGDLVLQTSGGAVRLHKPHIYQEVGGLKQPIDGEYVWRTLPLGEGPGEGTYQIGFQVASYDTSKPLVIDPVLSYATYLGGSGIEEGSITVDAAGNAYVNGRTESTNFPTMNPLQSTHSGGSSDAFVAKLNASGSALVYATYLGGSGDDRGGSIAVDASGNAYVTGMTQSTNLPTTSGAFQGTFGGFLDGFVTKLNATGSALVYSTYLGGSERDSGNSIAVDPSGNAYVAGGTFSTNFPTMNPLQATNAVAGREDAYVTKLNDTGSALIYSTYLGGNHDDQAHGIALDAAGNAYVSGSTVSTNFPTVNAFQASFGGGEADAFVAKLNATGSTLVYSTYLGGSGVESGGGIAVDAAGNVYVTGATGLTNFPITSGAFQSTFGGFADGFVTKLNVTGSALVYSTYLGGSGIDHPSSIAVDTNGNAYVTGATGSTNFPTVNPLQATYGGGTSDVIVAKISGSIEVIKVTIDIKPGSFPNSINLGSRGNVPVAIFSTTTFDATTVDPTTVTLASAPVKLKGNGTPMASFQDVNGDTRLDVVVQVSTESFQLNETDTEAVLEGKTFGGIPIRGTDSVRIVP